MSKLYDKQESDLRVLTDEIRERTLSFRKKTGTISIPGIPGIKLNIANLI